MNKRKITKDPRKANLITHTGRFHPDDVFSTVLLSKLLKKPLIARVSSVENRNPNAIVYDIGLGIYDHHGKEAKMRNEKIKYCSFGLLWNDFGRDYLKKVENENIEELFTIIEEKLVMQIDGIDNGNFPTITADYSLMDLDYVIDLFNTCWDEKKDSDEFFLIACDIAEQIFDQLIKKEKARVKAKKIIEQEIEKTVGNILVLQESMPFKDAICDSKNPKARNIKIVITPSNRGGYNIKPMATSKEEKTLVINFPQEWWGLKEEELKKVTQIPTIRFIHATGFLACTDTLEDAIALSKKTLEIETNSVA